MHTINTLQHLCNISKWTVSATHMLVSSPSEGSLSSFTSRVDNGAACDHNNMSGMINECPSYSISQDTVHEHTSSSHLFKNVQYMLGSRNGKYSISNDSIFSSYIAYLTPLIDCWTWIWQCAHGFIQTIHSKFPNIRCRRSSYHKNSVREVLNGRFRTVTQIPKCKHLFFLFFSPLHFKSLDKESCEDEQLIRCSCL